MWIYTFWLDIMLFFHLWPGSSLFSSLNSDQKRAALNLVDDFPEYTNGLWFSILSVQWLLCNKIDLCTDITSSEKDVPKRFLYPPSLTLLNFLHNIYYYRNYLYFFPCLLPLLEWKFHKHVDFEYFTAVFSNTTGLKQSFIHSKHSISISWWIK